MMKIVIVLVFCGLVLGLPETEPPESLPTELPMTATQDPVTATVTATPCRESTDEVNMQSIPWQSIRRGTLLRNDDFAESSIAMDPAGTRAELTVNTTSRECHRPFDYYYHQNPCRTTVTFEPLTDAVNVEGRGVTVVFPDNFQQIKCRDDRCQNCPGRCTQKYTYEMALVREDCDNVLWDRVKISSGCTCYY